MHRPGTSTIPAIHKALWEYSTIRRMHITKVAGDYCAIDRIRYYYTVVTAFFLGGKKSCTYTTISALFLRSPQDIHEITELQHH